MLVRMWVGVFFGTVWEAGPAVTARPMRLKSVAARTGERGSRLAASTVGPLAFIDAAAFFAAGFAAAPAADGRGRFGRTPAPRAPRCVSVRAPSVVCAPAFNPTRAPLTSSPARTRT